MLRRIKNFVKNCFLKRKSYRFFMRDWVPLSDLRVARDVLATMRFSQNLQPLILEGPNAERILVIAPHPDDETIGPGGTLLREIQKGAEVLVVYLTCGTSSTVEKLKTEAGQIASKYGYKTTFLNYFSKNIPLSQKLLRELSHIINQFSPDTFFLPFLLDDHDDHRRASHLLLLLKQNNLLKVSFEVWAYQVYTTLLSNVVVDITDMANEKKNMIAHWEMQNRTRNWAHFSLGLNAFNQRFLPNGPTEKYAECFFVLPLDEYLSYCAQYFERPEDCYYVSHYKHEVN